MLTIQILFLDEIYESKEVDLKDFEIKEEIVTDNEFEFEFCIDDTEYDQILKELRAKDSDLEEIEVSLSCPYADCTRTFSRKYNLNRHMRSHQVSSIESGGHVCHICGKHIKGVYSLHLKIHENLKQFRCNECGREFRQKIALKNHILIHENQKPHECKWCFKRFRQKYSLATHIKRHTGVKEFICGELLITFFIFNESLNISIFSDLCGKEVADKITLQKHSLVHSTNKPHQCGTCFMSFRHKSSLSRHTKIHLKTTQCHLCHRSFRYESFLKKHLISAHQDEDAIHQPHLQSAFTKDYRGKYSETQTGGGDENSANEECVVIAYDEDQNPTQIIQIDPTQYQYAAQTSSGMHNYT